MKHLHTLKAGIALVVAVAAASTAQAAAVSYFGNNPNANGAVVDAGGPGLDPKNQRDLFRNSLATWQREAFDMTPGPTSTLNNLFAAGSGISLSATDANVHTTSRVQNNHNGGGSFWTGRFNTTGDPAVLPVNPVNTSGWFESNRSSVEVTFVTAVSAFGTYFTDVGDYDGALKVEVFDASGLLFTSNLISAATRSRNGGLAFFGYTNTTQFNRVLFSSTQPSGLLPDEFDFIGFDDFITGTLRPTGGTIPEPTSLALVGLSLALLGYSRRRQSKA